jgi:hypothetical protein
MQWWNVDHWERIPVGADNTTLKNCNGVPTWVVNNCTVTIGGTGPAGGIVFYITADGTNNHGLEAAPVDQSSAAPWGCTGISIPGAQYTALGTGAANTAAIVAACLDAGTAALLASTYTLNGHSDWYLPSNDELNLLYSFHAVYPVVGGFVDIDEYWSSSEKTSNNAWHQSFGNGLQHYTAKFNTNPVRAVRAF